MLNLAHNLGWLSPDERRNELVRMLGELLAREAIAGTDVDLACTLNKDHDLDGALEPARLTVGPAPTTSGTPPFVPAWAAPKAHARTLKGLVSPVGRRCPDRANLSASPAHRGRQ